jgi:hypothetical protein
MVKTGAGSPPLMMKVASGVRKAGRAAAAEGERESIVGRKAARKRRPGEDVVGLRVSRGPLWIVVLPVAIVDAFVFEVLWIVF